MRAIAVLDDPAEVEDETVNAADNETSNVTADEEAGIIPYEAELEAENGDVIEEQPEEPVPEMPSVPVNVTQAEGMMSIEKISDMVYEAFNGTVDIMTAGNELDVAKSSIPWAFETAENITKIVEGFPDLSFLETYRKGRDEEQMRTHPESTAFPYPEKGKIYLAEDLSGIAVSRKNMGEILLGAKGKGGLTKEEAWRLYNLTEDEIMMEKDVISGLQKIPQDPWIDSMTKAVTRNMGTGEFMYPWARADPTNVMWGERSVELLVYTGRTQVELMQDVKSLENLRDSLLEMYPEFGGI